MRWLVLGSRGMFGSDMLEYLKNMNEDASGLNSKQLDLTEDIGFVEDKIKEFDVVINATAFTNVKLAETERAKAFEINAEVPAKLAQIAASNTQKLLHISTDYVFDGKKLSPYLTTDEPNPLNYYGESKLVGERLVAQNNQDALIIRTSWLYGLEGECFPRAIVDQIKMGTPIRVEAGRFGTPTSTGLLASFCYDATLSSFPGGIYHAVPRGRTSWYGFAQEICNGLEAVSVSPLQNTRIVPKRPENSQLEPHESISNTWQECWRELRGDFFKTN